MDDTIIDDIFYFEAASLEDGGHPFNCDNDKRTMKKWLENVKSLHQVDEKYCSKKETLHHSLYLRRLNENDKLGELPHDENRYPSGFINRVWDSQKEKFITDIGKVFRPNQFNIKVAFGDVAQELSINTNDEIFDTADRFFLAIRPDIFLLALINRWPMNLTSTTELRG